MLRIRLFPLVVSAVFLGAGANIGCNPAPDSPSSTITPSDQPSDEVKFTTLARDERVPEFNLADFEGNMVHVGPEQPVTLLNFWATWCAPCIEEFPDLEEIHQTLGPKGLRVLGLNVDELNVDALSEFGQKNGSTFTLLSDPFGDLQDRYKSIAMPSTFLIRADGTLEHLWTGRLPESALETIDNYLSTLTL